MCRKLSVSLTIIIMLIVGFSYSAPATDINLYTVDAPPFYVNQDINFGLDWNGNADVIHWKFGNDNNIIDDGIIETKIKEADFNAGNYNGWIVQLGTWSASSNNLKNTTAGQGKISTPMSLDMNNVRTEFKFTINFPLSASNFVIFAGTGSNWNMNNDPSYNLYVSTTGTPYLRRGDGVGNFINIVTGSAGDITANTDTNIVITRDVNGEWELFVNGTSKGTGVDTNFTQATSFWLDFREQNSYIDDIIVKTYQDFNINNPTYKVYSFSSGGKKTIQATIENADGNSSTSIDINILGSFTATIYDENTLQIIDNAYITFNGSTYNADENGVITIPLTSIGETTTQYTLYLDVNSDYTQRAFVYDLNKYSVYDVNLAALKTKDGLSIEYTMYDTDQITLLDNAKIELLRNGTTFISSIKKTGNDGKVSFFVQTDADYNMFITRQDNTTTTYYPTTITVYPPKREDDSTVITPINYSIAVSGLAQQNYSGLSDSKTFSIFSNTTNPYIVTVDVNADFYERKYAIKTYGNPITYSLQPYMTSTTTGTSMTLKTQRWGDYLPIPDTQILIYKYISGEGRVLIENVITDDKGEAFVSGIINEDYQFEVYYNNNLVNNFDITVTSSTIYFRFTPTQITPLPDNSYYDVSFYPPTSVLSLNQQELIQVISYLNTTISKITITAKTIDYNGDISDANIYSNIITSGITSGYTNTIDISTDLASWDTNKELLITVTMVTDQNEEFTKKQTYIYQYSVITNTWDYMTEGVRDTLSCDGEICGFLSLIALLISIGAAGTLLLKTPATEVQASLIFVIILIMFTLINWLHWALTLVSILITISYVVTNKRG